MLKTKTSSQSYLTQLQLTDRIRWTATWNAT